MERVGLFLTLFLFQGESLSIQICQNPLGTWDF